MFEQWSDRTTLRVLDPPRPVSIDWRTVDPAAGRPPGFSDKPLSLRIRAAGARVDAQMNAQQLGWLRMSDGQWRALCAVDIRSANNLSRLRLTLLVPPDALTVIENTTTRRVD